MFSRTSTLTPLANRILMLLAEKVNQDDFQAINKNMFVGESLETFFMVLKELKASGLVTFYMEYDYKPYTGFGDITPKQYNSMDIMLKITKTGIA